MSPWLPWVYQYGVGGIFVASTLALAWRSGALKIDRPEDKRLALALAAGYIGFALIHAVWIAKVAG